MLDTKNNLRVFIETFGCQMNILDSELVQGQFHKAGHKLVGTPDEANVVLLNTCSVRALSEQKVASRLGILHKRKLNGEKIVVGVLGCMAERAQEDLIKKRQVIDVLVGPSKIHDTLSLVEQAAAHKSRNVTTSLSNFVNRKGVANAASMSPMDSLEALDRSREIGVQPNQWQAYVRITRGCNKFCAFCVVPRTRGPEMHRPPESIIDEVRMLVDRGAREVTLLGQTINHYFYDHGDQKWSFAELLRQVHDQIPHLPRLRFLTSYPRDFTDEALDVMKSSPRICQYLHIPAQSGSDKVLLDMNRGYDLKTYLSLIERAKLRMPDIHLVGDMIVGFPTETDDDFEQSLDLLRKVRFKNVYIFKYSTRPNTTAAKNFPDVLPVDLIKKRHKKMLDTQNQIAQELHNDMCGKTFTVLCEGPAKINLDLVQLGSKEKVQLMGRTTGDHIVHFLGSPDLAGSLVPVKIQEARALSLSGTLA
jgi:tRNA-2-methylthio-N6-dimethylallyladenosine synthase